MMKVNYGYEERERAKQIALEEREKLLKEILSRVCELRMMIDTFPSYKFPLMVEARMINAVKWVTSFEGFLRKRIGK